MKEEKIVIMHKETKKHHIVSQGYLSKWKNSQNKFRIYDKINNKNSEINTLDNILCENKKYSFDLKDGEYRLGYLQALKEKYPHIQIDCFISLLRDELYPKFKSETINNDDIYKLNSKIEEKFNKKSDRLENYFAYIEDIFCKHRQSIIDNKYDCLQFQARHIDDLNQENCLDNFILYITNDVASFSHKEICRAFVEQGDAEKKNELRSIWKVERNMFFDMIYYMMIQLSKLLHVKDFPRSSKYELYVQLMYIAIDLADRFCNQCKFTILENNLDQDFITSDFPVVNLRDLNDNDIEMFFPLSRKTALLLHNNDNNTLVKDITEADIERYNNCIKDKAKRYIIM